MAVQNVAPGQWVKVRITTGSQRARIQIGDTHSVPAFIENQREGANVATYAQVRCPNMRPGQYRVYAMTDTETAETAIRVV